MIASLQLQLGPLVYLIVPVAVAVLLIVVVTLRHRRPKSLEANVESFNRGLQALSPDAPSGKRRRRRSAPVSSARPPARTVVPTRMGTGAMAVISSTTPRPAAGAPASGADAG